MDLEDHAHAFTKAEDTSKAEWGMFNKARVAMRRNWRPSKAASVWKPKKRRRAKTYQAIMQINNMLKVSGGVNLATFSKPKVGADGRRISPFLWRHLDLAPDMGPDMVSTDHALCYHKLLNVSCSYDIDHSTSCTGKQALKKSNLWPTSILVACANNAVYGSALRI